MITQIKKGDRFRCISVPPDAETVVGQIYTADEDGRILISGTKEAGYWVWPHNSEGWELVNKEFEYVDGATPPHYDNTHGSLYKIADLRGWNSYQFDIVKRVDRALKKGQFREDVEKTIALLRLWLDETDAND